MAKPNLTGRPKIQLVWFLLIISKSNIYPVNGGGIYENYLPFISNIVNMYLVVHNMLIDLEKGSYIMFHTSSPQSDDT